MKLCESKESLHDEETAGAAAMDVKEGGGREGAAEEPEKRESCEVNDVKTKTKNKGSWVFMLQVGVC